MYLLPEGGGRMEILLGIAATIFIVVVVGGLICQFLFGTGE